MISLINGWLPRSVSVLMIGCCLAPVAWSQTLNPADYPALTDKESGQIRHLIKLSNNLPGDWSGYGRNSEWEATETHIQFHLSFSILALALAQHQYTPAYRELYKTGMENYLKKLTHPDVWQRWGGMSSRGGSLGRKQEDFSRGWIDPVAQDNNMYKGYLTLSGAIYEMLYNDDRYQQPGAFTYKHGVTSAAFSNGIITFRYTLDDLVRGLHEEVLASNYLGSACEPGEYFWACNSVSNATFILYDHVHGTDYAEVVPKIKERWIELGGLKPRKYLVSSQLETSRDDRTNVLRASKAKDLPYSADFTGPWSGIFNNAWDSGFVKAAYYGPDGIDRNDALKYYTTGDYARDKPDPSRYSERWQPLISGYGAMSETGISIPSFKSIYWGFFLAYAAEMGDKEAVDKMLSYAERNFGPVWENGEYFYPRNDDYTVDSQGNSHGVEGWTGNIFLTLGRLNKGDGVRKLIFEDAWTNAERRAPEIVGIDAATTNVRQAWWDADKEALIVTLQPGPVKVPKTSFGVIRLDPGARYSVYIDGKQVGTITRGGALANGKISWEADRLSVSTTLVGQRSFIFVKS